MKYKSLIVLLLCAITGYTQQPFTVEVPATGYDRENMPVKIRISKLLQQGSYYRLKEKGSNQNLLARIDGDCLVFIPPAKIPAGKKLIFSVIPNAKKFEEVISFQTT